MSVSRRDALTLGGLTILGAAGLATPFGAAVQARAPSRLSAAGFPRRYAQDLVLPPVLAPTMADGTTPWVGGTQYYDITARKGSAPILGTGLNTPVFAYNGLVPGPVIKAEKGVPAQVRMRNHLPPDGPFGGHFEISTHLHGSESPPQDDGYAADITPVGWYKDYHYPNTQAARTLWYHDHGQHWTAQNAYGGLAAQYHLHDDVERSALPQGQFDVPLTVTDAIFGADGSLGYDDDTHSGLWGDVILVNGRAWPRLQVQRRAYRFRILNASIARSYTWRLSNGMPLNVVATDGGLVPKGVAVASFRHGGAERYEVVIDFSKAPAGTTRIELLNASNPNNRNYEFTSKVMAFDLVDTPVDKGDPTWNREYNGLFLADSEIMSRQPTGREKVVSLRVQRTLQQWSINGKTWIDVIDSDFKAVVANPALAETQVWEIENRSGGWFHPVHIHLIDFKVISRTGGAGKVLPHEAGPKDVVYVGEDEKVRLLCTFSSPSNRVGRYMVHCHNLPHEDHDMMQQFSVGTADFDDDPNDPITSNMPVPDPTYAA